uniref:Serpentine receptor class gamma n=1 Tax=Strongyloides venezuelensis TaxID=75913 RepID=A0A0K0G5S3_STRVS
MPYFTSRSITYYQIFYTIGLFGTISIATCIFNVKAILKLKKHNQMSSTYKRELFNIIYSIFIFITLSCVEAFYVCRVIVVQYEINLLVPILYFLHILAFDLTSVGDFYFLIYSNVELRNEMKNVFRCSKKLTAKINVNVVRIT